MRSAQTSGTSHRPAPDGGGPCVRTHTGTDADLALLADVLRTGGLVAIPTETVYGLAAHALDTEACRRIFEVKGRPLIDPLIVHVYDEAAAARLATLTPEARTLIAAYWPGPLTLVLPRRDCVPPIVTAGRATVALRSPRHPLTRRLLQVCGLPLAAPSANPFGYVSPTTPQHVIDSMGDRIAHLLDGGPCEIGLESTIVDLSTPGRPVLLRPGAITAAQVAQTLGTAVARPERTNHAPDSGGAAAPGMLERHYSPRTPLHLFAAADRAQAALQAAASPRGAVVHFSRPSVAPSGSAAVYWLSENGDLADAARHTFALLRQLDAAGHDHVWIEQAPEGGLGDAINDRLRRAATR